MSCIKGAIDNFFFVKWIKTEVADADQIVVDVRALNTEHDGRVRYIAIIGPEVEPPSDEVRSSMKSNVDELLQYCESVHIVIEGKGFRRAMARSIGTGIFLLSKNRGRTFAHDSVEQALTRAGADASEAGLVLARARERGFVTATT